MSFPQPTSLKQWCLDQATAEAISGGFFDRAAARPLGEIWLNGRRQNYTRPARDKNTRGSLQINRAGQLYLAPRFMLPGRPQVDLLQAGPMLVLNARNLLLDVEDPEGFSACSHQFDADISRGRFPRAAIATSQSYIWTIAVDGYNPASAGLSFKELADFCIGLGAERALNLDGGGSASLISGGRLINQPRSVGYKYPMCRPIYNAIILTIK